MKKIVLCVLSCLALWQVRAAEEGNWLTDFAKAQAQAKAENKLILMDFNGSDWCPPCKALRKNVLSTGEFAAFAKKNLVLLDVDFPRRTKLSEPQQKANEALAKKYGIEGFPTIIVLSKDGAQLKKSVGYGGESAKDFIAGIEKLLKKS